MLSNSSPAYGLSTHRGRIRVILADEQPLFRDALARALAQDPALELIGEAGDGPALVDTILRSKPDVALVDASLLGAMAVVDAARSTRLLVLAADVDGADAYEAVEAGAAGYISKDLEGDVIRRAVIAVARGETVLDSSVQTGIAREMRLRVRDEPPMLSTREREILVLIAEGRTAPQIALQLQVSTTTVKSHLIHLYAKLGVAERAAAVASAMRIGLLE